MYYAVPSEHPDFTSIQEIWYEKLKPDFTDIEDHTVGGFEIARNGKIPANQGGRPLKKWSGLASRDHSMPHHEPLAPLISNFPTTVVYQYENLLLSEDFDSICQFIVNRYPNGCIKIKSKDVKEIWLLFIEGLSIRAIGSELNIHYSTVYRSLQEIKKWL